jgi:hypothetical protein
MLTLPRLRGFVRKVRKYRYGAADANEFEESSLKLLDMQGMFCPYN